MSGTGTLMVCSLSAKAKLYDFPMLVSPTLALTSVSPLSLAMLSINPLSKGHSTVINDSIHLDMRVPSGWLFSQTLSHFEIPSTHRETRRLYKPKHQGLPLLGGQGALMWLFSMILGRWLLLDFFRNRNRENIGSLKRIYPAFILVSPIQFWSESH